MGSIVVPEEEFPLIVGEGDALSRDFKVDDGRRGQRTQVQQVSHGALDGLRSGQRFRVHGEQVEQIASGALCQQLASWAGQRLAARPVPLDQFPFGQDQLDGQSQRCNRVLVDKRRKRT